MIDLSSIATELQLPPEQLRVAVELLSQGYQPPFISSFRSDESGNLPESTLWRLKGILERQAALVAAQKKGLDEIDSSSHKIPGLDKAIQEARSAREIDRLLRPLHSKKNSFTFAERHPQAAKILEALQSNDAPAIDGLHAWVVAKFGIEAAQVEAILGQVRHLIVLKLSENPNLLSRLRRQISKKALLVAELIKEDSSSVTKVDQVAANSTSAASIAAAVAAEQHEEHKLPEVATAGDELGDDLLPHSEEEHEAEGDGEATPVGEETTVAVTQPTATEANASPAPQPEKGKKGKAEVRLTPRQRRRRWLQSMLQPYDGLKKPLHKLSSYQVVMLARGQRTQLIKTGLDYDRAGLVLMATESLVPPQHPLTNWMDEVASEALGRVVLPRIEQDVLAELEDHAHEKLLLQAGEHFSAFVTQRPLRGHRVLCIDAVGPKMAPLAIVCHKGNVLAIDEVPCQGGKSENKTAVVTKIGELVHKHRVSLIVLSNGPARRSLMPALAELLEQSTPGSVRFSLIDRTGADAYASTKIASDELGRFSRRHRSAVWLARRIQDSRHEILKIDVARLRLGSYQGELSTDRLRSTLNEVVSATMASDGIDVLHASESALQRIPGVSAEVAAAIVAIRDKGEITSRAQLLEALASIWPAQLSRQAIGFLRIYNSSNSLDGTTIHPDDYHLASRLATALGLSLPPAHPEGWSLPTPATAATAETAASTEAAAAAAENVESSEPSTAEPAATSESTEAVEAANTETDNAGEAASQSEEPKPTAETSSEVAETVQPETEASAAPAINNLDVEKHAKSWQVGREKLKRISRILQCPFEDRRLTQPLIPLWTKVPKLEDLQPGMSLWGVIVGLADFGAFADLGIDCQGLIHVSRLAPGYVEDPHQFVQIGDLIRVWVVSIDRDKKRISLSAIAPGTEAAQTRPPRGEGDNRQGGGRGQGQGQRPPRGGQGGDNRGPRGRESGPREGASAPREGGQRGSGPRDGGNRGGGPRNDGYRGGGAGRGRGPGKPRRNDESTTVETEEVRPVNKPKVERPSKPAPKLTEAMQKGREPLRSFSDLMQFYQTQKDPQPSSTTSSESSGNETGDTNTNSTE
ncbi:MAG: S1 RNA-binding domain-containing protein [Planctomycetes bacterium]|nr:S1 RNA-binding domain-containing protein [Planctomycetota bacterium]